MSSLNRFPPVRARFGWGWWCCLLCTLWGLVASGNAPAQDAGAAQPGATPTQPMQVLRLVAGEMALTGPLRPGDPVGQHSLPPSSGWQPVTLPDAFSRTPVMEGRTAWVRLRFSLPELPDVPPVLLVQRVVLTAEFRINGSLLNPGVRFEQPGGTAGTQMISRPHWMVLPLGVLQQGDNELLIRLSSGPLVPAWVSGISLGPTEALRGEFMLRDVVQRVVPQLLCVLLAGALVVAARLWWRERRAVPVDAVVTAGLWLAMLLWYLHPDVPLPRRQADALAGALWIAFHWALLQLLWRQAAPGWAWFPRLLAVGSLLPLAGAAWVLLQEPHESWLGLLMLPSALLRCATTVMLLQWAWRQRTRQAWLLTGCELLWFAGALQLMLVAMDVLPPDPFMLDPASGLPLVLALLWLGTQRVAEQREQATLARQAAVRDERQRLMLEMHDGVAGHLVTALRLARRDDVARDTLVQTLQDALHDLRALIDARDRAAGELMSLLQHWQTCQHARLQALGPRVVWHLQPLPQPRWLTPDEALNVLRILQEALNNVLQHAQPTTITIALRAVDGGCELQVCDDGAGLATRLPAPATGAPEGGRGLQSMLQRAARLGATLTVQPGPLRGTVVRLCLPHNTPAGAERAV